MKRQWKFLMLGLALVASVASGQGTKLDGEDDAPVPVPSAPPLVPSPEEAAPKALPAQLGNAPLPAPPAPGPERGARLGWSLAAAAGAGALVAVGGGLVGLALRPDPRLEPLGLPWTLAAVGFTVGAPIGATVAGWLLGGRGAFWAALGAAVVGLAVGAAATAFGGLAGAPLLFALPWGGSVLGFELTSGEDAR